MSEESRLTEAKDKAVEAKDKATGRWQQLQDDHLWIRHVADAWALLNRNHGNQYAGAITYFSFLALFPMLLLAVSVTGFVLFANPGLEDDLFNRITQEVPGSFGDTLREGIQQAIDNRGAVGIVGLVGVLFTGLGWIANLREAIDAVWGRAKLKRSFLAAKGSDLLVLGGLGLGVIVSLGLTVVGTSLTDQILGWVGLDDLPGSTVVLKILGIAIAVVGDAIIFWWLLVKLPVADVERPVAIKGALLAATGFEILKIVGTYTIAHASGSKTAGPFASVIAILVWIQLVSRFMLFCCAWIATVTAAGRTANSVPIMPVRVAEPAEDEDDDEPGPSPAAVGASLVGAGVVAGAVATWAATRAARGD